MAAVQSDFRFHHKLRVRFGETDMQGIVFNANYLVYYDVAWTEYLRAMGIELKHLAGIGSDMVLARTAMEFKSPAKFDDVLEVYARVSRIGDESITFDFEVYPESEDWLISSASSLYVCIDPELRPVPVPDELRARIGRFEGKDSR